MEFEIEQQHHRLGELAAALERLQLVPSDMSLVRELVAGSPPREIRDELDGIDALRPANPGQHRQHTALGGREHGRSSIPGGRPKTPTNRTRGIHKSVAVQHAFSSLDCLPGELAASPPFRPSFYSSQFRAEMRGSLDRRHLQFEECAHPVDNRHVDKGNAAPTSSGRMPTARGLSQADKRDAAEVRQLLLQQREERRQLEDLRAQLHTESQRLTTLAQRVRGEHAQVQRRSEACAIRERELKSKEEAMSTLTRKWKDELRRAKQQHANGIRVASAVNRQLHDELSRYGHSFEDGGCDEHM